MFNMKNTPLFFLEVSLVILPAFVYGIPILPTVHPLLTASLPGKPQLGDLDLLPEGLEAVVPKVPINIPIEPLDKFQVPLTEKLLEKKPLLKPEVQQLPLVDNINLLPEKPNEEEPLGVVASFLHISNIQVIIPAKLLEKLFLQKPVALLPVESEPKDGVVGLPEKLDGIVTEQLLLITVDSLPQAGEKENLGKPLSPLAVIASIPQIGDIQLVFSGELLKNLLSKKLIPFLPVEPKPEVADDTVLTATLEEIVPEKPLLLGKPQPLLVLPVESKPKLEEEVLKTNKPLLTPKTGKGELLDKPVSVKSKLDVGKGVVEQKPLPHGQDGKGLIPDVVNAISNLLPALPTFKPVLELSTHEKLPLASTE